MFRLVGYYLFIPYVPPRWGYTSLLQPTYAQKAGVQMTTVYNIVQAVLGTSK